MSVEDHDSEPDLKPEEPHLLDLTSLQEVAHWIALAAAGGMIGNASYDVLKAITKRHGSRRLEDLRERVYLELKEIQRRKRSLSQRDLRLRVDRLFDDFDG